MSKVKSNTEISATGVKFAADRMLGKLAKWLRVMGQDVIYGQHLAGYGLIRAARAENRLILTRDRGLKKKQPPDFLSNGLTERIAQRPVVFHLKAQLAAPGDETKDASQPWPDDRKVVELGVVTLNKLVPNSLEAEKKLLFMPTALTDGIELSDDPLPTVRGAAYAVSFARRSQPSSASSSKAPTQPSVVSP